MGPRARRGLVCSSITAILGLVAAGCFPVPPPPPPPTLCSTVGSTPAPGAQVALVDRGGSHASVVKFQAGTAADVNREVAQLSAQGRVLAVGPDLPVHAQVVNPTQNPDYGSLQTDLQAAEDDFPAAWNAGLDGTGVRVAVVDTGVQANHPDLAGNVIAGADFVVGNGPSNYARIDGYGHGTHVAGTIAAVDNTIGVVGGAPHATIVPVRVLNCQGAGFTSAVASGIEWASDPAGGNARVINLSLGGCGDDPVLRQAVVDAVGRGAVVAAAAGNNYNGAGSGCSYANQPEYPAAYAGAPYYYAGVLAVGALDGSTNRRAGFSNNNAYVTIAAPGVSIFSTLPFGGTLLSSSSGFGFLNGTSMATPHVAAAAALVLQRCPADTPGQVATKLTGGATALPVTADFQSGTVGLLRGDAVVAGVC